MAERDAVITGPSPFDELAVDVEDADAVLEAVRREVSGGGPVAMARWEPVQARLAEDPEARWWLALMSRCGVRPSEADRRMRRLAEEEPGSGAAVDAEALEGHLRANLDDPAERAEQLRSLIDLPELPPGAIWERGLGVEEE